MITKETVTKIANLARLTLTDDETTKFQSQLSDILALAETLNTLDVADIKPTAHAVEVDNVFRANGAAVASDIGGTVLKNAPRAEDGFFLVPKVLG